MDPFELPPFQYDSSSSDEDNIQTTQQNFQFLTTIVGTTLNEYHSTASSSRRYIHRDDRAESHKRLYDHYFNDTTTYTPELFERRFRMPKDLFLHIASDLEMNYDYFQTSYDARGRQSFTSIQKCTSAIRQLAYGDAPDALDEYLQMSERTSRESLSNFCDGVVCLYAKEFLRRPTYNDIQLLYQAHSEKHNFPGMLGSIDCTHWPWKNCPVEWRGQYTRGDYKVPTVMLEAVASQDLWFWHAFFGAPGSNNDLNVLDRSYVFSNILDGTAPKCPFTVNGVEYKFGYYLGDGIYPSWASIVKSFQHLSDNDLKRQRFKKAQEAARKDVERAFGVLKGKWQILHHPAKPMHPRTLRKIMYSCIILHNMILKWTGQAISPEYIEDPPSDEPPEENILQQLRSNTTHTNLRADIIEHLEHLSQQYHANN